METWLTAATSPTTATSTAIAAAARSAPIHAPASSVPGLLPPARSSRSAGLSLNTVRLRDLAPCHAGPTLSENLFHG